MVFLGGKVGLAPYCKQMTMQGAGAVRCNELFGDIIHAWSIFELIAAFLRP